MKIRRLRNKTLGCFTIYTYINVTYAVKEFIYLILLLSCKSVYNGMCGLNTSVDISAV